MRRRASSARHDSPAGSPCRRTAADRRRHPDANVRRTREPNATLPVAVARTTLFARRVRALRAGVRHVTARRVTPACHGASPRQRRRDPLLPYPTSGSRTRTQQHRELDGERTAIRASPDRSCPPADTPPRRLELPPTSTTYAESKRAAESFGELVVLVTRNKDRYRHRGGNTRSSDWEGRDASSLDRASRSAPHDRLRR